MSKGRRVPLPPRLATLHPALSAPGIMEAAMLHDVGQQIHDLLIAGMQDVNGIRGRRPTSAAPTVADLDAWGEVLPTPELRETWRVLIRALISLHAETCPLLAELTGQVCGQEGEP